MIMRWSDATPTNVLYEHTRFIHDEYADSHTIYIL